MTTAGRRTRHDTIAMLQRRISAAECGWTGAVKETVSALASLGVEPLDSALRGGMARTVLHEIQPAEYGDTPAAAGFGLALLMRFMSVTAGPALWCLRRHETSEFGRPYGPGLVTLGLAPERLLIVTVRTDVQALQAMEEALRAGALCAVMGRAEGVDLTASRRLSLAAAEGRTPCLLLRPHEAVCASAARTRWRVAALPGAAQAHDPLAPGLPRWLVTLTRCRNGRPDAWALEWDHETHHFRLAAPLADGQAEADGMPASPFRRSA